MRVPCKNCKDRKIPKTCETTCKKWIEYRKEYEKTKEIIRQQKILKRIFFGGSNENN